MKIFILSIATIFLSIACTKKDLAPTIVLNEMIDPQATLKYNGTFTNGPYGSVTGNVAVYENTNGNFQLVLENIQVSNGPSLKVYLSKEKQPVNFISLGNLKSTQGNQIYNITGTPDFTAYKYALIHCEQYNHLFGSAELNKVP